jgi:hypothetical protein
MQSSVRYFVEIDRHDGRYQGRLHQGDLTNARPLPNLQLGPSAEVIIKATPYPLGNLVQALIRYQQDDLRIAYDERGQLEIGRYLYTQIFGAMEPAERQRLREVQVDVRIVTEDEHVARLPWVLLADGSVFLSTVG